MLLRLLLLLLLLHRVEVLRDQVANVGHGLRVGQVDGVVVAQHAVEVGQNLVVVVMLLLLGRAER